MKPCREKWNPENAALPRKNVRASIERIYHPCKAELSSRENLLGKMKPIRFETSDWSNEHVSGVVMQWLSDKGAKILSRAPEEIEFKGRWWSRDLAGQLRGRFLISRDDHHFNVSAVIDRSMIHYTTLVPVALIGGFGAHLNEGDSLQYAIILPLAWLALSWGQGWLKTAILRYSLQCRLEENGATIEPNR